MGEHYKNKEERKEWQKSKWDIFETFAIELEENFENEEVPTSCNEDVKYALELQHNRLKEKDINLSYDFKPRGHFGFGCDIYKSWSDKKYTSRMDWRSCSFLKKFKRGKKILHKNKRNCNFYQIVTNYKNKQLVEDEDYSCPNCGGFNKIKDLVNGCAYCETKFQMDDLFPKVTNYYFVDDVGGTENEMKKEYLKTTIPIWIIVIIMLILYYLKASKELELIELILTMVFGFIGGGLGGAFIGYILLSLKLLFKVFGQLFSSMGMYKTLGSRKKFENKMMEISPDFSFEYFTSRIISILRMIMFSNNIEDLPFYEGNQKGTFSPNVVDIVYSGALGLKDFSIKDSYLYVKVDAFLDVWEEVNGKVIMKRQEFIIDLCRDITKPIEFNFSIKKIQCKHCGGSFDATKEKTCPYCHNEYSIKDEDWVVLNIQKC